MKHILLFLAVLILFIIGSKQVKSDELTDSQVKAEILWQVTQAIDMFQTLEIVEHGDLYYETNPILGKHPKNYEVVGYFITRGFLHYKITEWLPSKLRVPWLTVTVLPQIPIIEHNHNLGIRISW